MRKQVSGMALESEEDSPLFLPECDIIYIHSALVIILSHRAPCTHTHSHLDVIFSSQSTYTRIIVMYSTYAIAKQIRTKENKYKNIYMLLICKVTVLNKPSPTWHNVVMAEKHKS